MLWIVWMPDGVVEVFGICLNRARQILSGNKLNPDKRTRKSGKKLKKIKK